MHIYVTLIDYARWCKMMQTYARAPSRCVFDKVHTFDQDVITRRTETYLPSFFSQRGNNDAVGKRCHWHVIHVICPRWWNLRKLFSIILCFILSLFFFVFSTIPMVHKYVNKSYIFRAFPLKRFASMGIYKRGERTTWDNVHWAPCVLCQIIGERELWLLALDRLFSFASDNVLMGVYVS